MELSELGERLARLETAIHYERRLTDERFTRLEQQLADAPAAIVRKAIGWSGWLKILIAVSLPLIVWVVTGDWQQAKMAARLSGG
jgi:hypothetical protein